MERNEAAKRFGLCVRCIHGVPESMPCEGCYATEHMGCTSQFGPSGFTTTHRGCSLAALSDAAREEIK